MGSVVIIDATCESRGGDPSANQMVNGTITKATHGGMTSSRVINRNRITNSAEETGLLLATDAAWDATAGLTDVGSRRATLLRHRKSASDARRRTILGVCRVANGY